MNGTEFITRLSEVTEFSKVDTKKFVEAFESVVTETLANGEEIKLTGFGAFSVTERKSREGRNPSTGETMTIEASKAPKFKFAKGVKDLLNQ